MNVYIDVDGVLLANEQNAANYADEFIEYVSLNHRPFWLTTHCRGNPGQAIAVLERVLAANSTELIKSFQVTNWKIAKTEAIDFTKPFVWFDDDLFDEEREELLRRGVLDNWIEVDLNKDHNQLLKFIVSFPLPVKSS